MWIEEKEDGRIVILGDSRIERGWGHLAILLSTVTVRAVVLEYSQQHTCYVFHEF